MSNEACKLFDATLTQVCLPVKSLRRVFLIGEGLFISAVLEFELMALHLQGRCSIPLWSLVFLFFYFEIVIYSQKPQK
jgi:hypothetical protein